MVRFQFFSKIFFCFFFLGLPNPEKEVEILRPNFEKKIKKKSKIKMALNQFERMLFGKFAWTTKKKTLMVKFREHSMFDPRVLEIAKYAIPTLCDCGEVHLADYRIYERFSLRKHYFDGNHVHRKCLNRQCDEKVRLRCVESDAPILVTTPALFRASFETMKSLSLQDGLQKERFVRKLYGTQSPLRYTEHMHTKSCRRKRKRAMLAKAPAMFRAAGVPWFPFFQELVVSYLTLYELETLLSTAPIASRLRSSESRKKLY